MFDSYSSSRAQKVELGHFALGPILLGPHSVRGPTVNRVSYAREKFRESTLLCIPVENFHDSNNTLLIKLEFKMYQRKSFATMTELAKFSKLSPLLLLSNLPVRHWKAYTKSPSLSEVLTYSQGT